MSCYIEFWRISSSFSTLSIESIRHDADHPQRGEANRSQSYRSAGWTFSDQRKNQGCYRRPKSEPGRRYRECIFRVTFRQVVTVECYGKHKKANCRNKNQVAKR